MQAQHLMHECSVPDERINWITPSKLIEFRKFFKHVVLQWPFGLKVFPRRKGNRSLWMHSFSVYLQHRQPDLVFAILGNAIFCALIGRMISALPVPVICSIHTSQYFTNIREKQVHSALLEKADWVHAVSTGIKTELSELNWVDSKRIATIYNSVNCNHILKLAKQPSGHPWLDKKDRFNFKVALTVGRLQRQKNHHLLLRSFANVTRSENCKLIILGEGEGRDSLQTLVMNLNLVDVVSMPGWIDNPYPFLYHTDLFVLSSKWEGFPKILIEALVCGCNIVSTNCPTGPDEILDQGKFGTLVPVEDETAMTKAISRGFLSEPNRERLKNRARQFSPQRQTSEFERLFDQVFKIGRQK